METLNSFKGYGKVNEAEDREFRRRTRRRLVIIGVSAALLLFIVVAAVVGVVVSRRGGDDVPSSSTPSSPAASSIKAVCSVTRYPDSCFASLSSAANGSSVTDPEELFKLSVRVAMAGLGKVAALPGELAARTKDTRTKAALDICREMIEDSIDQLNDTLALVAAPGKDGKVLTQTRIDTLKTWLSATITDQTTCLDELGDTPAGKEIRERVAAALKNTTELSSNSLAIVTGLLSLLEKLNVPIHRKLLTVSTSSSSSSSSSSSLPSWISSDLHRRRLLQSTGGPPTNPDAVVAQDGTGQYKTIGEALASVPKKNAKPFVIYVKEGKYEGPVMVEKAKWNVVLVGDGADKTIITGSKNFAAGTPTFNTASFVVEGKGFMARGMGFENTAGPEGNQAVAVRVKADMVVFFQCSFTAFQDTLYVHSFRQFYRECDVAGTVDFIFGDASAVFQRCALRPRQPGPNQQNMITAQGRTDPNENTGISIQDSKVEPFGGAVTATTFLGRPWKPYSTTVFMKTDIGAVVDARGWRSWDGSASEPPATIFYGEYMNTGAGAGTAGRVKWASYKPALSTEEAAKYSVGSFIQGSEWLPSSGVAHELTV